MEEFLKLVYLLIGKIFENLFNFCKTIVLEFWHLFITAWGEYFNILKEYTKGFNAVQWIGTALLCLLIVGLMVLVLILLFYWIRHRIRLRRSMLDQEDLLAEINVLNRQVGDLMDEKSQILSMKVSQLGLRPGEKLPEPVKKAEDENKPIISRFPKLHNVDLKYADYIPPRYDNDITLKEFVERYRNYAASRLKLYYENDVIALFVAGMATSKLLILEGISGTGKTSLPYSFAHYLNNPCTLISVQPSFRERTELLGYFNEFSKRFNETEFLRALYEASYKEDPTLIVLDEMNLARIEYYFAEMLSVMEMPTAEEWIIDLVPTKWEGDPVLLKEGKLQISTHVWFVGTANNDDSTFTITDKVYDRSMPIELNRRAEAFEAPDTPPVYITSRHLEDLFNNAIRDYKMSDQMLEKINKLDVYLQTRFKLAFGNRIMKQLIKFVPVYTACGGDEMRALDYFIARKVLKKFESLNIGYVRDEVKELIVFIEKTFGKGSFAECKDYLVRIQNMF